MTENSIENPDGDALAMHLRRIRIGTFAGAIIWLALVTGFSHWYTERTVSKYVSEVASVSQREAVATAGIIDRSFTELDSISQVLARQPDLREAVSRHAKIASAFSALPPVERVRRLKNDPEAVKSGDGLQDIAASLGYDLIYVMDRNGNTIVSSDWRATPSLIGQNYADRPYFVNAMKTGIGRLYAVGRTTKVPGFYFAAWVVGDDGAMGVVVVNRRTETFARLMTAARNHTLITDRNGVIITASDRTMLMQHLGALAIARPDKTTARDVYARDRLNSLNIAAPEVRRHDSHWLLAGAPHIVSTASLRESDYRVIVMTPLDALKSISQSHLIIAILLALFGIAIAFALYGFAANSARTRDAAMYLQRLNQQLTTTNLEKNRYLGIVSHDLRNPLGSIRGLSQLMMEMSLEPEQRKQFLETIHRTSDEMLGLVNDLLDVAQIESGRLDLRRKDQDMGKLVEERLVHFKSAAARKNIVVGCTKQGALAVSIDTARFSQVIDNLISNAIKFSPVATNVQVCVEDASGMIRFSVEDEGPGISHADHKRLFKNFQTLSASPTGGEKSTGLGLAIVKKIVDAHNGSIVVERGAKGGAKFVVTIPASNTKTHGEG
jgi:C4-dicarboxylate-specific signal transduction histidine kinase